jgi:phage terminase large subunit-like protein
MLTPARYTEPLSENFTSDADWLLPIARIAWKAAFGKDYAFDEWQEWLIRRILETNPDGSLRYRQCFVSMPRQQGKSELASVIGLWSLLRADGVTNVGIASNADQARLVHERLMRVIQSNPSLSKIMTKITDTRGIVTKRGTKYIIRASSSATLQGIPVNTAIVDELHLVESTVYDAVISGTGARKNTLVFGITTAGDDDSELLKRLYENADKAIAGNMNGFGAFIWEASEAVVPEDDEGLLKLLMESNPALESGRLDKDILIQDVRTLPPQEIIRYRLNRFVDSSNTAFMPLALWQTCARSEKDKFPDTTRPIFTVDRSPDWEYATISVAAKDNDGITHTEIVASITKPTLEQLLKVCIKLGEHAPLVFGMDSYALRELGNELKARGYDVHLMSQNDIINASSLFYAKVAQKKIRHANDPLLTVQMPGTARKNVHDAFRISKQTSLSHIDGVMATAIAVFLAETKQDYGIQIF